MQLKPQRLPHKQLNRQQKLLKQMLKLQETPLRRLKPQAKAQETLRLGIEILQKLIKTQQPLQPQQL